MVNHFLDKQHCEFAQQTNASVLAVWKEKHYLLL